MLTSLFQWWTTEGLPGLQSAIQSLLPYRWAQYGFAVNALIECILLAPLCAGLGVHIVNFRLAFFSDAISHSAFTGVAIGLLLSEWAAGTGVSFDPRIPLIGFGLIVAVGVAMVRRKTELSNDAVVGVFFSAAVALGLAIVTAGGNRRFAFQNYLFGDVLTLDATDIGLTAILCVVALTVMAVASTPMTLIGLNSELASSMAYRVRRYEYLFSILLALVITISIRTAGILLVTGMMLVPAATAQNLSRTAGAMFRWAVLLGLVSGIGGALLSFSPWLDRVSTGSLIVLLSTTFFVVSIFVRRASA